MAHPRRKRVTPTRSEPFEAFYKKKWHGRATFWLDHYPPAMGLYADLLRHRNRAILRVLPERLGRVLDIGCGVGDVLHLLRGRSEELIGVDVSPTNISLAAANLARSGTADARLAVASADALPFADARMDCIVTADVIEHVHVSRRSEAVREMRRVLRPRGLLLCVTPDGPFQERLVRLDRAMGAPLKLAYRTIVRMTPPRLGPAQYESFLDRTSIEQLLGKNGFEVARMERVCFYPGPEGGGLFGYFLSRLARAPRLRAYLVEAPLRPLFTALERWGRLNQKMLFLAKAATAPQSAHYVRHRRTPPERQPRIG